MNKLQQLVTSTRELEEKMKRDGEAALKEAFAEFFRAHPEAKSVVWNQYTPYFNDGEACEFRVGDFILKLSTHAAEDVIKAMGADVDDDYECATNVLHYLRDTDDNRNSRHNPCTKVGVSLRQLSAQELSLVDDFEQLDRACHKIEKVMELTFGDHVKVTATRAGFDVTEYEHD